MGAVRAVLWIAVTAVLVGGGAVAAVESSGPDPGPSVPATVVDAPPFPLPGAAFPGAFPDVRVRVRPGQSFGIRYEELDYPENWSFGAAADPSVVAEGASITLSAPKPGMVGGSRTYLQVYRALRPGTTRIVWTLSCLGARISACHTTETFDVTVSAGP